MRVTRFFGWIVLAAVLLSKPTFAADSPPLGVYPTPPVPIAGERIVLIYRVAWIGFPVAFPKQEVQLNGNALDVTIFIERQALNGDMGVIATSVEVDPLPSGTYHLRSYSRISSVPTFSEENQLKRPRIGLRLLGGPCKQLIYGGRLEHGHAQDL